MRGLEPVLRPQAAGGEGAVGQVPRGKGTGKSPETGDGQDAVGCSGHSPLEQRVGASIDRPMTLMSPGW